MKLKKITSIKIISIKEFVHFYVKNHLIFKDYLAQYHIVYEKFLFVSRIALNQILTDLVNKPVSNQV